MERTTKWSATAKRKWLAGTLIFGLGVLSHVVHDYVRSFLGSYTATVEFTLLFVGVMILSWGAVGLYHTSGNYEKEPKAASARR